MLLRRVSNRWFEQTIVYDVFLPPKHGHEMGKSGLCLAYCVMLLPRYTREYKFVLMLKTK